MARRSNPYLLYASIRKDAQADYDAYPFNITAVREIGEIDFHPNVTFFVGENGSGKSTVLEGIAVALGFGAEGGKPGADSTFQLALKQWDASMWRLKVGVRKRGTIAGMWAG